MAEEELDALLKRMGAIAEAVNAFSSEAVQKEAFAALVGAFGGTAQPHREQPTPKDEPGSGEELKKRKVKRTRAKPKNGDETQTTTRKRKGGGAAFKVIRDLNLRPKGKQSFVEFIEAKQPKSNQDKFAVAIYYLEHVLELEKITIDHVGTVFRLTAGWREPANLLVALQVAAHRKNTITTDPDNLKTTAQGRNFVDYDLPPTEKPKK